MLSCGKYKVETGTGRDRWIREHYVKEGNSGMWYRCCEVRNDKSFTFNVEPAFVWKQGPTIPDFKELFMKKLMSLFGMYESNYTDQRVVFGMTP